MSFWVQFAAVMAASFAADVFWTLYFIKVEERKKFLASFWSSMIVLCGVFTITQYTHDPKLIPAAIIGAFFGTYAVLWYKEQEAKKDGKQK